MDDCILKQIKTKTTTYQIYEDVCVTNDLLNAIVNASNPVIVAGYGCMVSGAQKQVVQLNELMNIPVTTSLKGKNVVNEQSNLSLGSLGVTSYGKAYNYILEKADLIIFLGASFNERTSYVWDDKLLKNKKLHRLITILNNWKKSLRPILQYWVI